MKTSFFNTRTSSLCARASICRLTLAILVLSVTTAAQISPKPVQNKSKPAHATSKEKKLLTDILHDQRAIWTWPFHWSRGDAKWLAPLGLSTAALVATDRYTSGELVEHGDDATRLRISKDVGRMGSIYATGGLAAAFYLSGHARHNDRLRETGLLGAEALIDANIVSRGLKFASQRQRPTVDNSSGEFFDGGSSFPSGHAVNVWSLATIIAKEYGHHRPMVQVVAYGLATTVSLSRYTGRNHFLSDVLIGSAMGYGIGRYVYHKHHDPALDAENGPDNDDFPKTKLFPRVTPLYNPRAHAYGGTLVWNF